MPYKRSTFRLVGERSYQVNTFLTILGLVTITGLMVLITTLSVFISSAQAYELFTDSGSPVIQQVIYKSSAAILIVLLCSAFVVYFYSHKIAGPLYHFQKAVRSMLKGDTNAPIHLRKGDQFASLAKDLDELRLRLESKSGKKNVKKNHRRKHH